MEAIKNLTISETAFLISGVAFIAGFIWKGALTTHKLLKKFEEYETVLLEVDKHERSIRKLFAVLDEFSKESKAYRNTSLGDKIFNKFCNYKARGGKVTKEELENLQICKSRYILTLPNPSEWDSDVTKKYYDEIMEMEVITNDKLEKEIN